MTATNVWMLFLKRWRRSSPDALVQLGDFAYPQPKNRSLIERFNAAHDQSLHVIGNHDTDAGSTTEQCIEMWGMPGRYYMKDIKGIQLLVLDGNDSGSPDYKGGYPSYIGPEQVAWLKDRLKAIDGPIIVASHQPLAGPYAVDNADEIQAVLGSRRRQGDPRDQWSFAHRRDPSSREHHLLARQLRVVQVGRRRPSPPELRRGRARRTSLDLVHLSLSRSALRDHHDRS